MRSSRTRYRRLIHLSESSALFCSADPYRNLNPSRTGGGSSSAVRARYHFGIRGKLLRFHKILSAIARAVGVTVRTSDFHICSLYDTNVFQSSSDSRTRRQWFALGIVTLRLLLRERRQHEIVRNKGGFRQSG